MGIDLEGYFQRVGYTGPCTPTLATLRELHRLHPQAIPFENLDPLLGRPVLLDAGSLEGKLVQGGRGGYCFEQNLLFAGVLRALGFAVGEKTARVRWGVPEGGVTPRVHALLVVTAEGEDYLVDVGFGGNVATAPLLLSSREEQATPHEAFRLVEDDGHLVVEAMLAGNWASLYATDLAHTVPGDYELGNWFTSAHPGSIFVNGLLAARCEPDRRYAFKNNELAVHHLNGKTEKTVLRSAAELRDALTDLLRVRLPDDPALTPALNRLADMTP
jgi:N-hydroxyarylamine O-acetyltransferase